MKKNLFVFLFALALVSCGKDANTRTNPQSAAIVNSNGYITIGNGSQTYTSPKVMMNQFNQVPLTNGLQTGMDVYYVTPQTNFGGVNTGFNFQYCFFGLGNCQSNYGYNSNLQQLVQQGTYYRVSEVSTSQVVFHQATGIYNNQLEFGTSHVFTRNDQYYQAMFGQGYLGQQTGYYNATISLSNGSTVAARVVYTGSMAYITSTNFPVALNPLVELNPYTGQYTRALKYYGQNIEIVRIQYQVMSSYGQLTTQTLNL